MAHQLECLVLVSFELILQASGQEVHLPARVVEAELVAAASSQQLACPEISKQLAPHVIVLSQDDASLSHSSILWIAISLVSLELGINHFS